MGHFTWLLLGHLANTPSFQSSCQESTHKGTHAIVSDRCSGLSWLHCSLEIPWCLAPACEHIQDTSYSSISASHTLPYGIGEDHQKAKMPPFWSSHWLWILIHLKLHYMKFCPSPNPPLNPDNRIATFPVFIYKTEPIDHHRMLRHYIKLNLWAYLGLFVKKKEVF